MSKRNLITKLKHFSKTIFNNPKDTENHPSAEGQKAKTTKGHQQVTHIYNQTKKQLTSKSELLKQYADKAKLLTQKAKNQIQRGTQNMVNSATQLKKKISSETESRIGMAEKDKDGLLNSTRQSSGTKQQQSKQGNNEIKEKIQQKKGSLYQFGEKMKSKVYEEKYSLQKKTQKIIQSTNSYTKWIMELAKQKIGSQKKQSKSEINNYIEDSSNKNLVSASKQKPINKEEKQEQNFYPHMKIWEKIKDAQQSAISKLMIKNAQSKISSMLTNIYWRLIFGACFIVFAFGISTQIPKEIRIYLTEKDKLQKEQQNFLKAQKQGGYSAQKSNL